MRGLGPPQTTGEDRERLSKNPWGSVELPRPA